MEITTRRFLIRDFIEGDGRAFLAYHADHRYRAFSGPEEVEPGHAQSLLQTFKLWAGERPRRNYQLAIIQRLEPHALVGCCGLRGMGCEAGVAVLGIELAPEYWGRYAYAIEVAHALLRFGFDGLGLREIHGFTVTANTRIARLASWFGAIAVARHAGPAWMEARGWSQTEWHMTREQWVCALRLSSTPNRWSGSTKRRDG
jgi:[ribosomal protein S5]-alanine N-acetyltransferase